MPTVDRLKNEIEQGKRISSNAASIWGWPRAAGRLRWARRKDMLIKNLRPHHRVLEVGCGTGLLSKEIADRMDKLYAIDISPDLIDIAKNSVQKDNITFLCANAYDLEFQEDSFDAVVGMSVLHHLDVDKGLGEFWRILKSGGHIAFSEPNMLNPQIFLERTFFRKHFHNTVGIVSKVSEAIESIPLLSEIAGSLYIEAVKSVNWNDKNTLIMHV